MNKLISRNPILRFKEGLKILKFQNAGIISYKGRDGIDYEAFSGPRGWYYRKKGTLDGLRMPKNYVTTTGIKFYDSNGNMINNPSSLPKNNLKANTGANIASNTFDKNRIAKRHDYGKGEVKYSLDNNGIWYAKWTDSTRPNLGYYRVAEGSTGYNKAGDHNVLRNGKWVKITTPTQKKADPINWDNQYNNFSNNLTTSLKAWLTNEGVKYDNIEDMLKFLINKFGNNAVGTNGVVDKKWGSASQASWDKFVSQTDFTPKVNISPELVEKDRQTIINLTLPLPKLPTIPEGGISNFTPLSQTYNRAGVREFLRNKGVNPYNFSGDQRRALRMIMNGQGTDEDKALVQSMGIFKQGGQLPSRNIIERFKQRNFRLVAQ